jgi:hypothetical protein
VHGTALHHNQQNSTTQLTCKHNGASVCADEGYAEEVNERGWGVCVSSEVMNRCTIIVEVRG